jgi:hypothetical protein
LRSRLIIERKSTTRDVAINADRAVLVDNVFHVLGVRLPREMIRVDAVSRTLLRIVVASVETDSFVARGPCKREPVSIDKPAEE